MKTKMKKLLAVLLVAIMVFSTLPQAFAVSGNIDPEIIKETSTNSSSWF